MAAATTPPIPAAALAAACTEAVAACTEEVAACMAEAALVEEACTAAVECME